jgi:hypothetical protein
MSMDKKFFSGLLIRILFQNQRDLEKTCGEKLDFNGCTCGTYLLVLFADKIFVLSVLSLVVFKFFFLQTINFLFSCQ